MTPTMSAIDEEHTLNTHCPKYIECRISFKQSQKAGWNKKSDFWRMLKEIRLRVLA